MRRMAITVAMLAVAGCSTTPVDIVAKGPRFSWSSSKSARTVLDCVARNAENGDHRVSTTMRPTEREDGYELIVRGSDVGPIAVARSFSTAAGATVENWIAPFNLAPERYHRILAAGC